MSKLVLPEEELQLILQDYQNGESLMGICKKYHHGVSTLKRIFTEKGIHLRN